MGILQEGNDIKMKEKHFRCSYIDNSLSIVQTLIYTALEV
jgi:hypothetical protein